MADDHDRMEDSVAAFVLDACDEDEARRVRAHIVACPSCRALFKRLSAAAAALPVATEMERPPDRLRDRILDTALSGPPGAPVVAAEPPAAPRVVAFRRPVRRIPLAWGAVAALAAGVVVLGAWNVALHRQLDAPPAHYSLVGTGTLAGASGTVTALPRQDAAVVALTGMPQPPAGRVYELWVTDATGQTTPDGVFVPTASGTATLGINHPLSAVRAVAVTQETGPRGAQRPTTKPELAGQIGG
jgi:hypothetical protein